MTMTNHDFRDLEFVRNHRPDGLIGRNHWSEIFDLDKNPSLYLESEVAVDYVPTQAKPGSFEKIEAMRLRHSLALPVSHPDDKQEFRMKDEARVRFLSTDFTDWREEPYGSR